MHGGDSYGVVDVFPAPVSISKVLSGDFSPHLRPCAEKFLIFRTLKRKFFMEISANRCKFILLIEIFVETWVRNDDT